MAKFQSGPPALPNRATKSNAYESVSLGLNELCPDPTDFVPGSNPKNSARPRDASKSAYVQDLFCHKKGN
jgi:hypothetical protein